MNRILITGAGGFIGNALLKRLSQDSNNFLVVLRRDLTKEFPEADAVVQGDLEDFDCLRRVIAQYEITDIYHMAAQSIVRVCANDPVSAYETNVMGTVKLLEAVRQVGMNTIKSIVISTSDKAFGHAPAPYTEDTPLDPKFVYEATKTCQDIVGRNYFHNFDLPVKIARCSNIYGPGDPNWSRLVPNTIRRTLRGEAPTIYKDVAEFVREFVYIDDIVDAFLLLNEKGVNGEAYCVGGSQGPVSIAFLVEQILELCGSDLKPEYPVRAEVFKEIKEQWIEGSKIKALGWEAKVSLTEGLRRTLAYYKDRE